MGTRSITGPLILVAVGVLFLMNNIRPDFSPFAVKYHLPELLPPLEHRDGNQVHHRTPHPGRGRSPVPDEQHPPGFLALRDEVPPPGAPPAAGAQRWEPGPSPDPSSWSRSESCS